MSLKILLRSSRSLYSCMCVPLRDTRYVGRYPSSSVNKSLYQFYCSSLPPNDMIDILNKLKKRAESKVDSQEAGQSKDTFQTGENVGSERVWKKTEDRGDRLQNREDRGVRLQRREHGGDRFKRGEEREDSYLKSEKRWDNYKRSKDHEFERNEDLDDEFQMRENKQDRFQRSKERGDRLQRSKERGDKFQKKHESTDEFQVDEEEWDRSDTDGTVSNEIVSDDVFGDIPVIHAKATDNNLIVTLTNGAGDKVLGSSSCGIVGYNNRKKSTDVAAQHVAQDIAMKAHRKGITTLRVKIKGYSQRGLRFIRTLASSDIKVVSITDVTHVPLNGNKPRKKKR